MAAIFLAAKIEETPKRMRDVINVFNRIYQIRAGLPNEPITVLSSAVLLPLSLSLLSVALYSILLCVFGANFMLRIAHDRFIRVDSPSAGVLGHEGDTGEEGGVHPEGVRLPPRDRAPA